MRNAFYSSTLATALVLSGSTPTILGAQPAAEFRSRITTRIGEGAAQEQSFGKITGLAIDRNGVLYVSDGQDNQVRAFDVTGSKLATIGRKGDGPGEFQYPTSIALAPDGSLWVRDQVRVQRFAISASSKAATRFVSVVSAVPMADWMSERTGVIDNTGRFLVPKSYVSTRTTPHQHVQMMQQLDASGRIVDSLMVPEYPGQPAPYASYRTGPNGGRILRGLNHPPFAPIATWTATPRATIVSGDQRSYVVVETDRTGRVVRRFSRSIPASVIPANERRDSTRALAGRLDSIPVPMAQVLGMSEDVKARRLPTQFPAYRELIVSSDGMLWVRRWPTSAERGVSRFDVFAPDARFMGTVIVAAELVPSPSVVVSGAHAAGVQLDPDTGLQEIVRFEVPEKLRGSTR